MKFRNPIRIGLASVFTRVWWDEGPCNFTKASLIAMADGRDEAILLSELREFEKAGIVVFIREFSSAASGDDVIRLIALSRLDANEGFVPPEEPTTFPNRRRARFTKTSGQKSSVFFRQSRS